MKSSDEHVIPLDEFEFRIQGEDDDLEDNPNVVRYENAIGEIERGWDELVGQYGLDAVSTYVPFHEDEDTYGIYIRQRGIRFLGHLLYQWSRVGSLVETRKEATEFLLQNDLQSGDRLFDGKPQFDSIEDAFALAREILLRHQWFHHQAELLAAYAEDVADTLYYPQYHHQQLFPSSINESVEEAVANAYVARSQACVERSPSWLFQPLFERTVAARRSQTIHYTEFTDDDFDDGCYEVSRSLLAQGNSHPTRGGVELARRLVFDTRISRAIPTRISVYITRRESDSDNASYAQDEYPIGQTWTVVRTDTWKSAYKKADGSITSRIDSVVGDLKKDPRKIEWKGRGIGPKQRYYGDLLGGTKKIIFEVDDDRNRVELLDLGEHDLPREYGLHKS
ncbi:hypothetical protein [Natrinema sp. H-ect4]|uniref:hypothetical protein n=1 Tax=Natrinema sp. H-ect4 TaxID=3242699 RepID=UPI0035A89248